MKKLFSTFFALILCSATWGAVTTETYVVADTASKYNWESMSVHAELYLGSNITITATHVEKGPNGTYSSKWYAYQADNNGEFSIAAREGCWIQSIGIVNSPTNGTCIYKKGGTSEDKVADDGTAYAVNAHSITFNVGLGTKAGNARISQFSVTYKGEYFKQSDVTIGLINKGYKNVNLSSISGDAPLSYGSSNESVATVSDAGVITPVGAGTTTITAYYGANKTGYSTSYTLHVNKGIYYEAFSSQALGTKSDITSISGDAFDWTANSIRRSTADTLKTGQQGLWIQKDKYIQTKTDIEGGVKSIKFKWKQFGNEPGNTLKMEAQWGTSSTFELINQAAEETPIDHEETKNIGMASNSTLKFLNNSTKATDKSNACRIVLADIQFTPYLLFVNKTPSQDCKDATTFDFSTIIVDNTGATPEYTMTGADGTGCAGNFTGSVLDLSDVCKSGDIVVKATWNDVFTTTTLHVTALPAPDEVSLNVPSTLSATEGNRFQIIGSYTPATANPNLEWSTSNNEIVSVDQNGMVTVIAAGDEAVTITLASKADSNVKATCVITAAAMSDDVFEETFAQVPATYTSIVTSKTPFSGDDDIFSWTFRNFKRDATTKLGSAQGTELQSGNNYIVFTDAAQEGGVKRIAFQWRAVDATKPVIFDIDNMSTTKFSTSLPVNADFANIQEYSRDLNYDENMYLRIRVADASSSNIVFGPLTITPYLLFKQKTEDVDCKTKLSYDLNNILFNNTTGDAPQFTVVSETGCTSDDIKEGVLDLTNVTKIGDINITATWGDVTTTTKLMVTDAYSAVPTGVLLNVGATMDATVDNKFQIVGTVQPAEANPTITWSSNAEGVVFVDQNGMLDVKSAGTAIITAKDVKGHATSCTITVAATTDETFIEDYDKLEAQAEWKNAYTEYKGTLDQLWRVRNYRFSSATELQSGVAGVEIQHTVNTKSVNFVAYANADVEGGVKRVSFDWRAVDGTKPVKFDIDSTKSDVDVNLISLPANGGFDQVQSFSRDVNLDQNMQFRIHIVDATSSNVVFGPITVTPYLLYKTKSVQLTPAQCDERGYKYINTAIINNTGSALENEAISYSISGENNDKIAQLNTATGELSLIGKGTVTVTATWGKVSTSYTLEVTDKLTPIISEFSDTEIDIFGSYAPTPVFKIGDVVLTDAAYTFSSGTSAVASVKNNVFTIRRTGTSVITATLTGTDYYNTISPAPTCTLTVTKPTEGAWEETYETFTATSGYKTGNSFKEAGKDNVYQWQLRAYRYGSNKDKVNGENGISLNRDKEANNYIAFNTPYEGGVKDVFFNWQLLGTTNRTAQFTLYNGKSTVIDAYSASATAGKYYSYAHHVNIKSDFMLKIVIPEGGDSIVFGPITIVPYLLYTEKTKEIPLSSEPYTHPIMDNTNGDGTITYAITDGDVDAATINTETGAVTMNDIGSVTVTATWVPSGSPQTSVTTSYQLSSGSNPRLETFSGGTQTDKYCDPASQVKARFSYWMCSLSGIRADLNGMTTKAVAMRAPTAEETTAGKSSYIESVVSTAKDAMKNGLSKLALVWNLDKEETGVNWDIRFYVNGRLVRTLTNEDITATTTMASPASIVIDDINELGTFQIRVENHSTLISGEPITGEHACINFDNFEYFPYDGPLVLDEEQDNSIKISNHDEETLNVTLKRKLSAGKYNTFCVPFDITKDALKTALGVTSITLSTLNTEQPGELKEDGGQKNLNIAMKEVDNIEAGKPYLLEIDKAVEQFTIEGVTIQKTDNNYFQSSEGGAVKFYGITSKFEIPAENSYLFMSNNRLSWNASSEPAYMKGLRSYFHVTNGGSSIAARLVFHQPSTPTSIDDAESRQVGTSCTMQGIQKMIINNQLIIIRDGKMYNAQGQIVK